VSCELVCEAILECDGYGGIDVATRREGRVDS
jgi:hypothetical protein